MHEPFLIALCHPAEGILHRSWTLSKVSILPLQLKSSCPPAVPSACLHRAHTGSCCGSAARWACTGAAYTLFASCTSKQTAGTLQDMDPAGPADPARPLCAKQSSSCCIWSGSEAAAQCKAGPQNGSCMGTCCTPVHQQCCWAASAGRGPTCWSWLEGLPARWPIHLCQGRLQGGLCQQLRGPDASHLCQHSRCGIDLHQDNR